MNHLKKIDAIKGYVAAFTIFLESFNHFEGFTIQSKEFKVNQSAKVLIENYSKLTFDKFVELDYTKYLLITTKWFANQKFSEKLTKKKIINFGQIKDQNLQLITQLNIGLQDLIIKNLLKTDLGIHATHKIYMRKLNISSIPICAEGNVQLWELGHNNNLAKTGDDFWMEFLLIGEETGYILYYGSGD